MEKLIIEVKEVFGKILETITEYGKKDLQYLIVVNKLNSDLLKKVRPFVRKFYGKYKKVPLILTIEEIKDGLDVFPLEFLNIKLNHNIIYGKDIFESLSFDKDNIRRELEFEFRSKLINLRQGYLESVSDKELKIIVDKAIPTLLPILNVLLYLKNVKIPESLDNILDKITKEYKINIDVLKKLNSKEKIDLEETVKELIILLSSLGEILDEVEVN